MRRRYSHRAICWIAIVFGMCLPVAFGSISLNFSGTIDGSDVIFIQTDHAIWNHLYWSYPPSPVIFNGSSWNPQTSPELTFPKPLIPACLRDYVVTTTVNSGRDVAVAEIKGDHLLIYLNDTPNGSSYYDIQVLLTETNPPAFSPSATLTIQGLIDGSDRLRITLGQAQWIHQYWSTPTNIFLNGVAWNPSQQTILTNAGSTTFLPAGIDFTTAKLTKNAGRDTAMIEIFDGHIDIIFADNPLGADIYDVTVSFGTVPQSFQDWQMYYFCCTNCPQSAADADPDGDGQNNQAEFLSGTIPTNSASVLQITSVAREGNSMRLTWTTGVGRTNVLERTGGASGGYSTNFAVIFTVTNTTGTVTNYLDVNSATNEPAIFYRVRLIP